MNIFFEEWNYKTNGESPAFTVHTLLQCLLWPPIPPGCPSTVASFVPAALLDTESLFLGQGEGNSAQHHREEGTGREAKS